MPVYNSKFTVACQVFFSLLAAAFSLKKQPPQRHATAADAVPVRRTAKKGRRPTAARKKSGASFGPYRPYTRT